MASAYIKLHASYFRIKQTYFFNSWIWSSQSTLDFETENYLVEFP